MRHADSPSVLEPRERGGVAGDVEPPVEEKLRRREHDAAVDVVLHLPPGVVADAHRTHAAIARERLRRFGLDERALEMDAVDRLQARRRPIRRD